MTSIAEHTLRDARAENISACPVHFIWDGRGMGRLPVRIGFMGFVVGAMLYTSQIALRMDVLSTLASWTFMGSLASYAVGQVLSAWAKRQHAKR